MRYISTRGNADALSFLDVVATGLAPDGGLYVPETFPKFTEQDIAGMASLSYQELVLKVIEPFVGGEIDSATLEQLIENAYRTFRHQAIAPLKQIGQQEFLLELFHGPTLAFKDFALQLLGQLFDYVLTLRDERVVVVGATSGDTGSAAIEGCRLSDRVEIFMMHPYQRVSEVQRRQMTTILSDNVYNIALEGTFDDCQDMTKSLFNDPSFLQGKTRLVAVNSINWCRILAQIVYYFYAAVHLGAPQRKVSFSVPTGNFGDVFAGYIAKQMGLPIGQLVIATNSNDILRRFIADNDYSRGELLHTLSPSMDIQIASNFERLLFFAHDGDGAKVAEMMATFREHGLSVEAERLKAIRQSFSSHAVSDARMCGVLSDMYKQTQEVIDPHTAIGVEAGRVCRHSPEEMMVILATAHPAKFPDALEKANVPTATLPPHMADLFEREERYDVLANERGKITDYILSHSTS